MSVHKRKDGRHCVAYRDPVTKKVRYEYFRGPDAELRAKARNAQLELRPYKTKETTDPTPLLEEIFQLYLDAKASTGMSKASIRNLHLKLDRIINPEIGHLSTGKLTNQVLDRYVARRLKKVKATTVCRDLDDIRASLSWAVRQGYVRSNPLVGYERPKRDDATFRPPSTDEVQAILEHSPPHLVRALMLSFYLGLRPGIAELAYLKWDDVDFDQGLVHVRSASKGGLKARLIPVRKSVIDFLKKWRKEDELKDDEDEVSIGERCPYIVNWRRRPVISLKKAFASAKDKAGITRRLRPYDLRHGFATILLENGADLKSVSMMLGHSRPDTTMRSYQHVSMDLLRRSTDLLPDIKLPDKQNVCRKNNIKNT